VKFLSPIVELGPVLDLKRRQYSKNSQFIITSGYYPPSWIFNER